MIIIWGFRLVGKQIGEGEFFCPNCGADRHYVLRLMRRWFTFFWIPIFPTGKEFGQQVRCATCKSSYRPEVLGTPTSAALSEHMRDATRVAAVAVVATGDRTDPGARAAAMTTIRGVGLVEYGDAALDADFGQIDLSRVADHVRPLAGGLNEQGREHFVQQAAAVAAAGGSITPTQLEVLRTIGGALGLSPAHVTGVIAAAGGPAAAAASAIAVAPQPDPALSAAFQGATTPDLAPPDPATAAPVMMPPPAPPVAGPPAAWYPDPSGTGKQRWWNGTAWTDQTRP